MSVTIQPSHAYALLAGLYVGKFTNFFSDLVITGLVLYIVTPQIFTEDRLDRAKNWFWSWFERKPITIKVSDLNLTEEQKLKLKLLDNEHHQSLLDFSKLPKIETMPSPKIIPITNKINES